MASQKHYDVWIKSLCPYCIQAQQLLLAKAQSHTLHVMDHQLDELDNVKNLWNHPTVPLVVFRDGDEEKFIGGYTDLVSWLESLPEVGDDD